MFEAKHVKMPLIDTGCFRTYVVWSELSDPNQNDRCYRGPKSQTLVKPRF